MKAKDKIETRVKVRRWKMMEVVEEDDKDDDWSASNGEWEFKEVHKRKKSRRPIKPYSKANVSEHEDVRSVARVCPASPELDTVRIYFDCSKLIDLDSFIPDTATKTIKSVMRNAVGEVCYDTEFYRTEMSMSWWGKMQVSRELKRFGTNGSDSRPVLSFEFSVAKWWHYASGVNSGEEPRAELVLLPCLQAMKILGIENYSNRPFGYIASEFVKYAEIRRFDLSINFDIPLCYTPTEYIELISHCYINRQKATPEGTGSISYGTDKSPYRVILYDKERETKKYYNTLDKRPPIVYVDDEGERHVFDFNLERRNFYLKNSHLFKNKMRFEVQFRTKFIKEHNLMANGKENIDNVIRLGAIYWREILDQIDEQLNRCNFQYSESVKEPICKVLSTLEDRRDEGVYSRTKANNMIAFIKDCYRKGWRSVYNEIGRDLFSRSYRWVKTEMDYDVKVTLPEQLPIMRIMDTILMSRQGTMISQYRLNPSPVQVCAV